jgi:chemotaxis regulatin CheY-phosphate phosphatase CheZ
METKPVRDQDFQGELQELLSAARAMAEGNFHRTVNVKARGIVGELAAYINRTLHNLQTLDPTVKDSQREIPKVARHLAEIIQTTEEATNRVLEQTEHLVDEQMKVEQHLSRVGEMLHLVPKGNRVTEIARSLEETKEIQRRSQGRAMDIMAAMEFQDLTTQKIQKLIGLVAEVESRLLRLLVMFRIEDTADGGDPADPIIATCTRDESALCDQGLVDQLLREFQTKQR